MKEGWEEKRIGDVIEHLRTGLNPRTHFKLNTPDADGYYITVRELKGFTIEPDKKTDKVNSAAIKRINERSNLKIGDVLFSGTGTIGKTALVSELPNKWNIKEGVYAMTPKHSELDSKWFIYYISSEFFLKLVNDKAAGTGVRSIPMKELVKLPIHFPSLSEQQSIVDYLDSAFAKIDAMKANAEQALNEAKSLFQASLKEMLEPKEGWEEKILGDIAEDSADGPFGSNLKKEHYTTRKEVRIIQLSNIGEDGWREENTKYTTFEHLKDISRSEVEPNDIVIAKMMPAGRAILCPSHEPKFVLSSDAVKIKLKRGIETRFILHSINSPYFRNEVYENVTGSGRVRTSLTKLRACRIFLPSILEQQSIVATLDSLKSKVDKLQANYDKISQECDALKQAILREVFE